VPSYILAFDVTHYSISSEFLAQSCKIIHQLFENNEFPYKDTEAKICILTYDTMIHYYAIKGSNKQPKMIVGADLPSSLPLPLEEILCDFSDAKSNVLSLLETLPKCFSSNSLPDKSSCLIDLIKNMELILKDANAKVVILQAAQLHQEQAI
jgi:hypothetical protein